MRKLWKWLRANNRWTWLLGLIVFLAFMFGPNLFGGDKNDKLPLSQLQTEVDTNHVKKVELSSKDQKATVWPGAAAAHTMFLI